MPILRHVPWTCRWGEFGAASFVEAGDKQWKAPSCGGREWSPWTCLNPRVRPEGGYLAKGDCDTCPFWSARVEQAAS